MVSVYQVYEEKIAPFLLIVQSEGLHVLSQQRVETLSCYRTLTSGSNYFLHNIWTQLVGREFTLP